MGTENVNSRYQLLTTPPAIQGDPTEGLFTPTVDQKYRLGTKLFDHRGRVWRYAKNGGVALDPALMAQSEAPKAELLDEVQTAYTTSIGQTSIRVLVTTASGILDGDLADGFLCTRDGTGEGYLYGIRWNQWITGDTVMLLELVEPIRVATAATSEFDIVKNRFSSVVVMPTTVAGVVAGCPNVVIPIGYYGWLQTKGYCPIIVDDGDTLIIGDLVGTPAAHATAGGVGIPAITTDIWGRAVTVAAAGETAIIDLHLE